MTQKEFFGDWSPYIDFQSLNRALIHIQREGNFLPSADKVFEVFKVCKPDDITMVWLGQDPYPQKDVATGLAFANKADTPEKRISPSLNVLKEAMINFEINHATIVFDNSLMHLAKQGVMLLNSSLTVKPYSPGSHAFYWRPFMRFFVKKFSETHPGMPWILFGRQAQSFEKDINPNCGIFKAEHPASLARKHEKLPYTLFTNVNKYLFDRNGIRIRWYDEL